MTAPTTRDARARRRIALDARSSSTRRRRATADVERAVAAAVAALGAARARPSMRTQLRRRLEADVSVFVGRRRGARGRRREPPPVARPPSGRDRLARSGRPTASGRCGGCRPDVVRALDRMTDEILGRLEDPRRDGPLGPARHGRRPGPVRQDGELHRPDLQGGGRRLQVHRRARGPAQQPAQPDPAAARRGIPRARLADVARVREHEPRDRRGRWRAQPPARATRSPRARRRATSHKGVATRVAGRDRLRPRPARRQEEQDDPREPDRRGSPSINGRPRPEDRPHGRVGLSAARDRRRGRQRQRQHQEDRVRDG